MSYPIGFPSTAPLVTLTHRTYHPSTLHASLRRDDSDARARAHTHTASPATWVLEMHNGADSRLTEAFLQHALRPALDAVERHWRNNWRAGAAPGGDAALCHGALVIVGNRKQDKFFSNGAFRARSPNARRAGGRGT